MSKRVIPVFIENNIPHMYLTGGESNKEPSFYMVVLNTPKSIRHIGPFMSLADANSAATLIELVEVIIKDGIERTRGKEIEEMVDMMVGFSEKKE